MDEVVADFGVCVTFRNRRLGVLHRSVSRNRVRDEGVRGTLRDGHGVNQRACRVQWDRQLTASSTSSVA